MSRGKTKRRRIAKAWRRAHQKLQVVGWDQDGIQLVDRGFAWFPKSKLRVGEPLLEVPYPEGVEPGHYRITGVSSELSIEVRP